MNDENNKHNGIAIAAIIVSVVICGVCLFTSIGSQLVDYGKGLISNTFGFAKSSQQGTVSVPTESLTAGTLTRADLIRVVDGDTFVVNIDDVETKIRLIGVDTPESVAPSDYSKENTEEGLAVSAIVEARLTSEPYLYVEYDVERIDKYDRTLVYLYFSDGVMVQDWLLKNGYARIATVAPNIKYAEHFTALERVARENKEGFWDGFFEEL